MPSRLRTLEPDNNFDGDRTDKCSEWRQQGQLLVQLASCSFIASLWGQIIYKDLIVATPTLRLDSPPLAQFLHPETLSETLRIP